MTMKTALVTGATGFIGSHLAHRLVLEGWNVHLIVRSKSDLSPVRKILDQVTIHRHDGHMEDMLSIMAKVKPTIVIHVASLVKTQHSPGDVEPLLHSNLIFSTQLVEAMVRNGVYHFINTGTSWQHYENKDYSPVCLYAATKQAFEAILTYFTETTPLQAITLKLFDTYGPNDNRAKLFNLLRKAEEVAYPLAMTPGEQLIDLVYIDDIIDAYLISMQRLFMKVVKNQEAYMISSGNPMKLKELVQAYSRITGKQLFIDWGGLPYRTREVMEPWNRGLLLPGWRPKVTLEEGIRRIINVK